MKRTYSMLVCLAVTTLGFGAAGWRQIAFNLNAQDSPANAKSKAPDRRLLQPREEPSAPDARTYPIYFVDDLIENLTKHAEEFLQKKLVKNSAALKKGLERTEFAVKPMEISKKELLPAQLYRRAAESVFLVAGLTRPGEDEKAWQTSFSTAFVIHEDGILSTSAHVFDHDDPDHAVVAMDVLGEIYPVIEVLAANRKTDTCLFRIAKKGLKPLPLGKDALPGTPIRVMGHPGDSFFFFSAGHVANFEEDEEGQLWMNITADFGQGSSGGPVMDPAGNVVAQVSRTYTLYAGGETSNRGRRRRRLSRQAADGEKVVKTKDADEKESSKNKSDPQMVFKACTPASAIRSLMK